MFSNVLEMFWGLVSGLLFTLEPDNGLAIAYNVITVLAHVLVALFSLFSGHGGSPA
jgi:hypothetical protein